MFYKITHIFYESIKESFIVRKEMICSLIRQEFAFIACSLKPNLLRISIVFFSIDK